MVSRAAERGSIVKQEVRNYTVLERRTLTKSFQLMLNRDRCFGCGICVKRCPKDAITFFPTNPIDFTCEKCVLCGKCVVSCPTDALSLIIEGEAKIPVVEGVNYLFSPEIAEEYSELENFIFGRNRKLDETFGICSQALVARSTDRDVLKKCQDGGVVTTLLTSALKSGMIDGAVVSGVDPANPWLPVPVVATTYDEIVANAGIRYSFSPSFLAIPGGVSNNLKKMALVGTSCQILAVRRIQKEGEHFKLRMYADAVAFNIGLFCKSSFTYDGLMIKKIREEMGIDLSQIRKINIKKKITVYLKSGEIREIPLREAYRYAPLRCKYCRDFSSELADISVGALALEGWNLVLIRTGKGAKIFENAVNVGLLETKPVDMFDLPMKILVKLSKLKRKES